MNKTITVALALAALLLPVRAQALDNETLLALVAMPLAVAAVSEVADIPMNELVDVVTLLNEAAVPPAQFLEVVRYVPVALIVEQPVGPRFVEYVRLREAEGLRGTALVNSIEDQLRLYDIDVLKLSVDRPRVVDITDDFLPLVVRERLVANRKAHPHGGPPGQLKKTAGVQTGAEIVHGTKPGPVATRKADDKPRKPTRVKTDDDRGKGKPVVQRDDGHSSDHGKSNGGHKDKGHGKGKG